MLFMGYFGFVHLALFDLFTLVQLDLSLGSEFIQGRAEIFPSSFYSVSPRGDAWRTHNQISYRQQTYKPGLSNPQM